MSRPPLRLVLVNEDGFEDGRIGELLRSAGDLEVERMSHLPTRDDGSSTLFLLSADCLDDLVSSAVARGRQEAQSYARRILVRDGARVSFVAVEDIDWIEAAGNYVRLHTNGNSHLLRSGIGEIEEKLDPSAFARIHRSSIVNLDRVNEIRSEEGERYVVALDDGTNLTLSRSYRDLLKRDTI